MISELTFYNMSILYVLKDPKYFEMSNKEVARNTANLIFYGNIASMFLVLVTGY